MTMTVSLYSSKHTSIHRPHQKTASNLMKKREIYAQKRQFSVLLTSFGKSSLPFCEHYMRQTKSIGSISRALSYVIATSETRKKYGNTLGTVPNNYSVSV